MFFNFRLDVISVCSDHIELIYHTNLIQKVNKIELWDRDQSEEWENGDWVHIEIEDDTIFQGSNVVRLNSLQKGHMYDVRLIGLGNDGESKILTRNGVKATGMF